MLLLMISALFEISRKSDYISFFENQEIKLFFKDFIRKKGEGFYHNYDYHTKNGIKVLFSEKGKFILGNVIKRGHIYELRFSKDLHKNNLITGFFLGFNTHKIKVRKIGGEYKVIHFK